MMTPEELEAENARLKKELSEFNEENRQLKEENKKLREEIASLKTTVSAVVVRGIGAKADSSNNKKSVPPGRKNGHEGRSRKKPKHIDARIELDQPTCPKCGGQLSKDPTDEYTRVVEDIVPARLVVTEYVIRRRYCKRCGRQVSPSIPNVVDGGSNHERFGLRLMLLIVSLKLLGLSYAKIGSLFGLLFDLDVTDAAIEHSVMKIAEASGPRYEELKSDLRKEKSLNGDETSWRIKGKNHWLWIFVGEWSVIYEIDRSRGKTAPLNVLGNDYQGTVVSDSWPAWNYVGKEHQRCLQHYRRDVDDTLTYKSPGIEFLPFAEKLRRILNDAIRVGKTISAKKDRLKAKRRFERRIEELIESYSSIQEEKRTAAHQRRAARTTGSV